MEINVPTTSVQHLLDAVRISGVLVTALECVDRISPTASTNVSDDSATTELHTLLADLPKVKYLNESTTFHFEPYKAAKKP